MSGKLYTIFKNTFQKATKLLGFNVIRYNVYTSESVLLQTIINNFRINTIIDVGANEGQYAAQVIEGNFKGKIYSFEPIHSVFRNLEANALPFRNWKVFNLGIGSEEAKIPINVSENFVSSSILPISITSVEVEPKTRPTHTEQIQITTLDAFFLKNPSLAKEILLKLDVQGYELEALKGARKCLPSIKLVQVELSLVPIYEGAPLYKEVINFLEESGFELYSLIPGFMDGKTGRLLQVDGIFLNKN